MKITDISNNKAREIIDGAPSEATHFSCIEGKVQYYKGEETVISSLDEVFINVFRDIFQPSVFPLSDLENQMNIDNLATQTPEEKEALDLIDTTPHQYEGVASKEVEWPVVGAIVSTSYGEGEILAEAFVSGYSKWLVQFKDTYRAFDAKKLQKQETKQQREERERMEAAYDLYCHWCIAMRYPKFSFEQFTACERDKAGMLAIVDKTNYRKESN